MNQELRRALDAHDGVLTRRVALGIVTARVLQYATHTGDLHRIHPQVYVDPARRHEPRLRWRAALAYAGPKAALCGVTALVAWGVGDPTDEVHVVTPGSTRLRGGGGLVVHRGTDLDLERDTVLRGGIRVTRLERSVVDSVRQVPTDRRRTPFIEAVARRMTTPERLRTAVESTPNLPDRLMLLRLTSLLALGCRSELELCGYDHVFRGLPDLRRQVPIRAGRRTVYLDIYAEPERVNFELDGAGYHSAPIDRERDLQRDAALGALGIMVVRFTHRRLTTDPASVRREALAILAARRRAA